MSQALDVPRFAARPRPMPVRALLGATLAVAAAAGVLATSHATAAQAVLDAGADLTRLLRAMALLKLAIVAAAAAVAFWRFKYPASRALMTAYLASLAAMAMAPGLIWGMAHVVAGAVLLHSGLATFVVLVWRDPGCPAMLPHGLAARG